MNEPRRIQVAVIGDARLEDSDRRVGIAETVGRRLVDYGCRVVTGGLGGVMAAACRGAHLSERWFEGATIGILPTGDPDDANEWVDVTVPTGLDYSRNVLVAQSDAVIAIGGGAGTLSELALAWMHHRLIVAVRCGGWSERLADTRVDDRIRYPDISDDRIYGVATGSDAVDMVLQLAPSYRRRHRAVPKPQP
jgi:uncharacterized protein (TIGR00725 family)